MRHDSEGISPGPGGAVPDDPPERAHQDTSASAGPAGTAAQAAARDSSPARSGRQTTGDSRVDGAIADLDRLDGMPAAEHVPVFEQLHDTLSQVLSEIDSAAGGAATGTAPGGAATGAAPGGAGR